MSDDLAERLRGLVGWQVGDVPSRIHQAADLIEELTAENARLDKACREWAEVSQSNYQRAKAAEAKLAMAVDVIDWALICWDDHKEHGYMMQGDWVSDARAILAELKG